MTPTGDTDLTAHSTSEAHAEAVASAGVQGLLFDDDLSPMPDDVGFRGPIACAAAGITYRQLDYWARTGLVSPSVRPATERRSTRAQGHLSRFADPKQGRPGRHGPCDDPGTIAHRPFRKSTNWRTSRKPTPCL